MYDMIRQQLGSSVPFAAHTGVRLVDLDAGQASAELDQTANSINHIGSQHAGALFTLGEAASGALMAGMFAPVLLNVRPIAADASIRYTRIAKGRISARARSEASADTLLSTLARDGRVSFPIEVVMTDETGEPVATMQVGWHVSARRAA